MGKSFHIIRGSRPKSFGVIYFDAICIELPTFWVLATVRPDVVNVLVDM